MYTTPMNTNSIWTWISRSSADPKNLSLTLKSLGALLVLFGVDSSVTDEGVGAIVSIVTAVGMLISAITALVGIARKVKLGKWSATPSDNYSPD